MSSDGSRPYYRYHPGEFDHLRPAVCVVIAHPVRAGHLLMVQRAAHDVGGGFWTPVTGSCDDGESEEDACVREVLEETGLAIRPRRKIWECPNSFRSHVLHWWTAIVDAPAERTGRTDHPADPAVTLQKDELDDFRWCTLAQAMALSPMFEDTRYFFEEFGGGIFA